MEETSTSVNELPKRNIKQDNRQENDKNIENNTKKFTSNKEIIL
jgi:hypothetical protein